jgi:hypothetical protein
VARFQPAATMAGVMRWVQTSRSERPESIGAIVPRLRREGGGGRGEERAQAAAE